MAGAEESMIDLFAGCGGMSRGFVDAGFEPISAVEWDLAAASTYAANFGEAHVHQGDVTQYLDIPKARVVIGGPPCQGFSLLGKKNPLDERNRLWREFVRVVVAADCDIFVMENVSQFAKSIEFQLLQAETWAKHQLHGYEIEAFTLNSADFGAAQRRIRTVIVGSRIGAIEPPVHTHWRKPKDGQDGWRTLKDAIGSLDYASPPPVDLPARTSEYFGTEVPGEYKIDEIHVGRNYQQKSLQRYALIPPGGSRTALPDHLLYDCWKDYTTGSKDVLGRLEWDKPALTIRTEFFKPEKGRFLHPQWEPKGLQVNRALTHAEAARLQGFDERHLWCGSKIDVARQIGNAVPPPLAFAVALQVRDRLG